ncbi:MAG: hypothetical protein Q8880_05505, partial [Bacteroidota bacterium]|nr:hypothetical protein [Bacteroidota bacterium]
MKKLVLIVFVLFCTGKVFCQGFYIKSSSGYAFGYGLGKIGDDTYKNWTANGTENGNSISSVINNTDEKYKAILGTFGQGLKFNLTGGYMLNPRFGLELQLGYLKSKTFDFNTYQNTTTNVNIANTTNSYIWVSNRSYKYIDNATQMRINPNLIFYLFRNRLSLYTKIGILVGVETKITTENDYEGTDTYSNGRPGIYHSYKKVYELTGGYSLGFCGALGLTYNIIGEKLSAFTEFEFISMSFSPENEKMVEYNVDGVQRAADNFST